MNDNDSDLDEYDPLKAPDPEAWQTLDEGERILLVRDYHSEAGVKLPNLDLHAALHVVVENQVAMGDEIPVRATLERLMDEGLDRHEAIHAVASVLAEHLNELMQGGDAGADVNETYYRNLKRLTVARWLKDYG